MPLFFVRARNSMFDARDDGAEYERPEAALAIGVQGAIAIIAEEVNRGERSTAIEISVERKDGTQVLRSVMAVSVSPLMPISRPRRSGTLADNQDA